VGEGHQAIPLRLLISETGLSRRGLIKARKGQTRPHFRNRLLIKDVVKKLSTQTSLPQTLAIEIRAVYRTLKSRVREHGGGKDLTPSQISVLVQLEKHGAATVSCLARAERMRPQSNERNRRSVAGVRPH
jgi:hypothetical protein